MSDDAARAEQRALPRCPHCGGDHPAAQLKCPDTDMALPLEGRMLHGKFRFVRQLGRGGMAAVWAAINILVERPVAIKLIRPDAGRNAETVARFRTEAKATGRIGHPNVCEILDFGLGPLGPYIVMERLRGLNLGQLIQREERLDPALVVTIVRQALSGLEAAHRHGIIHRDLKPENLFMHQPEEGEPTVKVMDFGVSKLTDGSSEVETEHGALLGTPEYMAPEQFKGAAHSTVRTDIWAMGAILYKALTGATAFGGPSVAGTLLRVTTEEPTPIDQLVRGVPPELVAIVERCLDKDPQQRFASADALSEELEPFDLQTLEGLMVVEPGDDLDESAGPTIALPGRGTGASAVAAPERPSGEQPTLLPPTQPPGPDERRPSRRERRAWLLIGGVTVVGAGVLYMLARGPASTPADAHRSQGLATTPTAHPTNLVDLGSALPTGSGGTTGDASTGDASTGDASTGDASTGDASTGPGSTSSGGSDTGAPSRRDDGEAEADDDDGGGGSAGPAYDPSKPLPIPPGTARVDRYLTPKQAGPTGTQADAKAYCRGLSRQSFAGVTEWKLASPIVAKKLARVVRRGKYWTSALWKGKALVYALPSKKQDSRPADKSGPRALCFARWP